MQKGKRKKFTTMMKSEVSDKLKKLAIDHKCSVADILEALALDYIRENEKSLSISE